MAYRRRTRVKTPKRILFPILFILVATILGGSIFGFRYYKYLFSSNIIVSNTDDPYLYIPSKANFDDLLSILSLGNYLKDLESFTWVAEKKNYNKVKGGRYLLKNGMSNSELINLLRSGRQTPLQLTFNNIRTKKQFAGYIGQKLEADSIELLNLLNDNDFLKSFNLNTETALTLFIPNTYELWWTTSAKDFISRMHKEHTRFWTSNRKSQAKAIKLSPTEVSVLASIVDEETIKKDEKPIVAGLYINRLNKGIRLQADPTIKYAINDFTVKRILNKDLEIDSPYNTYKYKGLPPGPIRIPSIAGIDAVLQHKKHKYLYMCAKEDFSGYHNFAKTLTEHNKNADRYRNALRENKIYR